MHIYIHVTQHNTTKHNTNRFERTFESHEVATSSPAALPACPVCMYVLMYVCGIEWVGPNGAASSPSSSRKDSSSDSVTHPSSAILVKSTF